MTEIALDLEEVLADTIRESCRSTDKLDIEDFQSWDLEQEVWQIYSGVSDALWRHDPYSIPPVEPGIDEATREMKERADTVDIVTARLHVDDSVEQWLDYYDVSYDNIVSTDEPKQRLSYDLYVDDNPDMVGECRLLLRDHPHNSSAAAVATKTCDRIYDISEVVRYL